MISKLAARVMDFLVNLSPSQKALALAERAAAKGSHITDARVAADDIRRGSDNILNSLGYVRANVSGATPGQIVKLQRLTKKRLRQARKSGDQAAIKRELEALENSKNSDFYTNPIAVQNGAFNNEWYGAGVNPYLRLVHTKHIQPVSKEIREEIGRAAPESIIAHVDGGKHKTFNTAIDRHEAYEAVEKESIRRRLPENLEDIKEKFINNASAAYGKSSGLTQKEFKECLEQFFTPSLNPTEAAQKKAFIASLLGKKAGVIKAISPDGKTQGMVGSHLNMRVLEKERSMYDRFPVQDDPGMQEFRKLRNISGETAFMDAAGNYTARPGGERFNKKNVANMNTLGTNSILVNVNGSPMYMNRAY